MTTKPISPEKLRKAAAILQCAIAIAEHCKADVTRMFSEKAHKGQPLQNACALLAYHLYNCGMSFDAIARQMKRSVDHVRRLEAKGSICMMGSDREMIDSLPRIPSALKTTPAD